jgi:hypothetical protein
MHNIVKSVTRLGKGGQCLQVNNLRGFFYEIHKETYDTFTGIVKIDKLCEIKLL